jgi:Asp/Glu/hydantoin racemase
MRILMLNPNTSRSVTDLIAGAARAAAAPGTEIVPATAPRGVPYIATRAEAVIGGAVALEMLAELHGGVDAAVIAAFGDPALGGARELFPIPVVGLAEAGMLTACMLGARFAIVTFAQALEPWYRECVEWHGLDRRCAGVRALGRRFPLDRRRPAEKEDLLVELALRAVEEDRADVVVLAGAPLAASRRASPAASRCRWWTAWRPSVKQAEALIALRPRKATRAPTAGRTRRTPLA